MSNSKKKSTSNKDLAELLNSDIDPTKEKFKKEVERFVDKYSKKTEKITFLSKICSTIRKKIDIFLDEFGLKDQELRSRVLTQETGQSHQLNTSSIKKSFYDCRKALFFVFIYIEKIAPKQQVIFHLINESKLFQFFKIVFLMNVEFKQFQHMQVEFKEQNVFTLTYFGLEITDLFTKFLEMVYLFESMKKFVFENFLNYFCQGVQQFLKNKEKLLENDRFSFEIFIYLGSGISFFSSSFEKYNSSRINTAKKRLWIRILEILNEQISSEMIYCNFIEFFTHKFYHQNLLEDKESYQQRDKSVNFVKNIWEEKIEKFKKQNGIFQKKIKNNKDHENSIGI